MKNILDILKKGFAVAFVAAIGYGCGGDRPQANPDLEDRDTSTSRAITERNPSAANLSNPRPAPIGDTATTANQQQRFGNLPSNVDSAARELNRVDRERQLRENPNQEPVMSTPENRRTGTGRRN